MSRQKLRVFCASLCSIAVLYAPGASADWKRFLDKTNETLDVVDQITNPQERGDPGDSSQQQSADNQKQRNQGGWKKRDNAEGQDARAQQVNAATSVQPAAGGAAARSAGGTTSGWRKGDYRDSSEFDVLGVRIGMSMDRVEQHMRGKRPDMKVTASDDYRFTDSTIRLPQLYFESHKQRDPQTNRNYYETIRVVFALPEAGGGVALIRRYKIYESSQQPTLENTRTALEQKYGRPDSFYGNMDTMVWGYGGDGLRLPNEGTTRLRNGYQYCDDNGNNNAVSLTRTERCRFLVKVEMKPALSRSTNQSAYLGTLDATVVDWRPIRASHNYLSTVALDQAQQSASAKRGSAEGAGMPDL